MKPSDYIKRGWCQGTYYADENGKPINQPPEDKPFSCCILGALEQAEPNQSKVAEYIERIRAEIGAFIMISDWNDTRDRTQQEVIDLLEKVGL